MCRVYGIKGTILRSINSVHHFPTFHLDFPFPGNGDVCILDYSLVSNHNREKTEIMKPSLWYVYGLRDTIRLVVYFIYANQSFQSVKKLEHKKERRDLKRKSRIGTPYGTYLNLSLEFI